MARVNTTGLGAGVALSAAGTGAIIDAFGARAGYVVTACAGIATILTVVLAAGALRSSNTSSGPSSLTPDAEAFDDGPQ